MRADLAIACAIDQNYLLPLAVMLESLKQRLHPGLRPVLYLAHRGIPQAGLDVVSSIVETRPIVPSAVQLAGAPRDAHFPPEASFPLLLPELLPAGLERVLFLDADLLVLGDLRSLWETSLDGCVLAAVADGAVPFCASPRGVKGCVARGIPADALYFNGGVLLIDLARWRERDVTRRAQRYLESATERVDFLHQEALNAVLWDDWRPLDARWNLLASRAGRIHGRIPAEIWRRPGIVHFAGRMKPWRAAVGGPFNEPYREALERVRPVIGSGPATWRDRLIGVYDRHFRAVCYPLEQLLWRQRLI